MLSALHTNEILDKTIIPKEKLSPFGLVEELVVGP
jgi:hypothetical protein